MLEIETVERESFGLFVLYFFLMLGESSLITHPDGMVSLRIQKPLTGMPLPRPPGSLLEK